MRQSGRLGEAIDLGLLKGHVTDNYSLAETTNAHEAENATRAEQEMSYFVFDDHSDCNDGGSRLSLIE